MVFFTVHPFDFSAASPRSLWLLIGVVGALCAAGVALTQPTTVAHTYSSPPVRHNRLL